MADERKIPEEDTEPDHGTSSPENIPGTERTPEAPVNFFAAPYEVKGSTVKPAQTGKRYTEADADARMTADAHSDRGGRGMNPSVGEHPRNDGTVQVDTPRTGDPEAASDRRSTEDIRREAPDFSDIGAEIDEEFEDIGEGFDHIGEKESARRTPLEVHDAEPYEEEAPKTIPASSPESEASKPIADAGVPGDAEANPRKPRKATGHESSPADESGGEPLPAVKRSSVGARVGTGAAFSITITICLLASPISSMVVIALLNAFCSFEFFRMMHIDGKLPNDVAGIIVSALYPPCYFFGGGMYVIALTAMLMIFLLVWYVFSPRTKISDLALTLFGTIYCGLMLSSLLLIRLSIPGLTGGILAFGVALSVWGNDAIAYFFGSRFGKHKLAPKISPHKSWEGFWAGIVGSMIAWCLIPIFVPQLSYVTAIIAGIVCGVADLIGDFAESRIKRGAGVKDSGHALPGHGGFLDRCDSMIFVSVVALFVLFLGGML